MIDSRLLHVFSVVAEELHFGRAAQRLHISQPPLSQSIRKLEEALGARLLIRSTRSVRLTAAGAELHRRVRQLSADSEAMVRAVQQTAKGEVGHLVIGLTPSAAYSNLSEVLYEFRRRYPTVSLDLREMNSNAMPEALHLRQLDLALLRPPFADPDLAPLRVYDEPMLVAMRKDHPLARKRWVTMNQVLDHDLIGYSRHNSRYFSQIQQLMTGAVHTGAVQTGAVQTGLGQPGAGQKPPRIVMESMIPTILTLVEAGFGLALVPAALSRMRTDTLVYAGVRGPGAMRAELLAARQPSSVNPAIDRFIAIMQAVGTHGGRRGTPGLGR
ncbi:HTH lysR-type domain-containing protein [Bordetella sputigena]|uniref:LysR family transcriptional regulator n=1 Tax=Bordetella sputigena TaxID=1416810 RepID=UPI0039EEFC07